ncbi:MAG: hypothetical protein ABSC37_14215, partial [Xanthobacteraceae bacterium]
MAGQRNENSYQIRSARYISEMYTSGRWLLTVVGYGFAAIFTALQVRNITVVQLVNSIDGRSLTHLALLLYYYAWVIGSRIEFTFSEKVYVSDPNRGRISTNIGVLIFGLVVLGIVFFFVADSERYLSFALTAFFAIDFALWVLVCKRAKKMASASADILKNQHLYARIEQLRCYSRYYIRGNWQYVRYIARGITLLMILIICIPLRLENPKFGRIDDPEIIGDRIAEYRPVFRHVLAQELQ